MRHSFTWIWLVAFPLFLLELSGCATSAVTRNEMAMHKEHAYLAISASMSDGVIEEMTVSTPGLREHVLSLGRPTLHVADEDIYIYDLSPDVSYAITSMSTGNHVAKAGSQDLKRTQIHLQPGTITYVGSFMLWGDNGNMGWVSSPATAKTGTSVALKRDFPDYKFNYGFQ